jgi:uncharacterized membrane protein
MTAPKFFQKIKSNWFSSEPICVDEVHARKTADIFAALAIIFGILLIYLNPPMVCPDENAHYMNICRIIGGSVFVDMQDGVMGSVITQDQADFINAYNGHYSGLDSEKYTFKDAYFLSHLNYSGDQKVFYPSSVSNINPLAYIVQATGAFIAQKLFKVTSPYNILIWAKLSNLLFFVIVTRIAILKAPVMRNTMFLIALMPMTIYQCSSTSYDSAVIACMFLFFTYSIKLIRADDDYRIGFEDIFAICFSCTFIFAGKIAYAPIVLIMLAVNIKKFGSVKKYIGCISLVAAIGIVFYLIPTALTSYYTSGALNAYALQPIVIEQNEYFKNHLIRLPSIILNTTIGTMPFWVNGFFGILGSLDINFPQPFIYLYLLILLITALTELGMIDKVNKRARLFSFIGVLTFFVGTSVAMYTGWTPLVTGEVGGDYFTGIQGRYFIPVAMFAAIIIANPSLRHFKYSHKLIETQTHTVRFTVIGYLSLMCMVVLTKIWI